MSTTNQYLIFYIYLSDPVLVASLQGTLQPVDPAAGLTGNGIGAILCAPDAAAIKYGAPIISSHAPVVAPGISSTWFGTDAQFPTNVATFDRKSGGWFGWSWLFGDTTHYYWRGIFVYVPGATPVGGPTLQPIMPRRWIDGFQIPGGGEGGGGSGLLNYSREASRHANGLGLAIRGTATGLRSHRTNDYGGAAKASSWERFYIRLRTAPTASQTFWATTSSLSPAAGCALQMTPGRQIALCGVDAVGTLRFVAATPAIDLDRWYRLDVLLVFGGVTFGVVTLYQNGVQTLVAQITEMSGVGNLHVSSTLGPGANGIALDVCDWMNADPPALLTGIDWKSGSCMSLIRPTALDPASSVNWTGDVRALQQLAGTNANASMTSATAAANLLALTDAHAVIAENPEAIGFVAMVACLLGQTGVQLANTLGFVGADLTLGTPTGLGVVMATGSLNWLWNQGAGLTALTLTQALKLQYNHGNAGATTLKNLLGVVELIGVFGPEDAPVGITPAPAGLPARLGVHNSPYPWTPWARQTTTPIQPVLLVTGTYVGNGTGQDLTFAVPVHFFRTRPLVTDQGGAVWWSSQVGPHTGVEQQYQCSHLSLAQIDPDFVAGALDTQQQRTKLSIAGAHTQSNAAGVTYAYVAICDPGMRFLLNAVIKNHRGTVDMITTLPHPRFTPLLAFFQFEGFASGATAGLFFKGPSHALQTVAAVSGADTVNALEFGLGTLTNRSAFNSLAVAGDDVAVSLMRSSDGSLDDGVANAGKVLQIFTYTGDGAASRTQACTPPSGKRPMFGVVLPHGSNTAIYRDPSHTGTTSSGYTTGTLNAATGIVGGGIDTISVGSALNANGVLYDVLVVPGDVVAGNAGWSIAGTFMPVSPDPPPDAPFDPLSPQEPPDPPVEDPSAPASPLPDPLAPIGPMPGLADDLAAACTVDTHRIVNVALSRLGLSQQIANLATEVSTEAAVARLEYKDAVEATLRDFPWPFATRYAQLVVVPPTPPNSDWAFAYRQPSDCVFERRLVVTREGAVDPTPPAFQLSSDFQPGVDEDLVAIPPVVGVPASGGGLILTNQIAAVLEYTARPKCPHTKSEPLFRDAVSWRLAAAMSPALTRLEDKTKYCQTMYLATLDEARQVLRPGNPGPTVITTTVDVSAAAQAANIAAVNRALIRIGAQTIRNLTTDLSREAMAARLIFEAELRATLRDFPWAFATAYVTPALVAGTASVRVNDDWQYAYRAPADLLFARRIVSSAGRRYERDPPPFRVGHDAIGPLLYTDQAAAVFEYTRRLEGAVLFGDALFGDALAWRLAASLAPSLAQVVPETPEQLGRGPEDTRLPKERPATGNSLRSRATAYAWQMYRVAILRAQIAAANEAQPTTERGEADWIAGRN